MNLFKMAWRNLWRNRRRSVVTIGAMSFALLILLLYAGIVEGLLVAMEDDVLDYEVGDLQVFAAGYLDNPSLYSRIDDPEAVLAALDAAGYPASARLLAGGLAAAGDLSAGVSFRGVDVEREARVSRVHERIAEGEWLDPGDARGVVLGRRLARILEARPGDELVVLSQGADGSIANDLFTVRGVLGTVELMLEELKSGTFPVPAKDLEAREAFRRFGADEWDERRVKYGGDGSAGKAAAE